MIHEIGSPPRKSLEGKQARLNLVLQNFLSPDAKNLESDYEKTLVNFFSDFIHFCKCQDQFVTVSRGFPKVQVPYRSKRSQLPRPP